MADGLVMSQFMVRESKPCLKCGHEIPVGYSMCPCWTRAELLDAGIDPDCGFQQEYPIPYRPLVTEVAPVQHPDQSDIMDAIACSLSLRSEIQGQINYLFHKVAELEQRKSKPKQQFAEFKEG